MENTLTYEQALERLEELQQLLEAGEVGIDDLAPTMQEAKKLMEYCKQRLRSTEEQLKLLQEDPR